MIYGIGNINKAAEGYEIVRCNNCWTYYYEEIIDPRKNNTLVYIWDEDDEQLFKACPQCKTDNYLIDIDKNYLTEIQSKLATTEFLTRLPAREHS